MIQASNNLKSYIQLHENNEVIAKRWDVSRQTVFNILNNKHNISSELIAKILMDTGMEFEKAFEVGE